MLQNLEYVEAMYKRLKDSTEDKEVIKAAKGYLSGIRADLKLRKSEGRYRKGG
jgi:Chromatin remodeling factor Mit1 C-terminal Zn finger 2